MASEIWIVLHSGHALRMDWTDDGEDPVTSVRATLEEGGTFVVPTEEVTVVDLGARMTAARKRLGWTQAELAERLDRSVSWVSQVERGERGVDRMSVLAEIARVLEFDHTAGVEGRVTVVPAASVRLVQVAPERY